MTPCFRSIAVQAVSVLNKDRCCQTPNFYEHYYLYNTHVVCETILPKGVHPNFFLHVCPWQPTVSSALKLHIHACMRVGIPCSFCIIVYIIGRTPCHSTLTTFAYKIKTDGTSCTSMTAAMQRHWPFRPVLRTGTAAETRHGDLSRERLS